MEDIDGGLHPAVDGQSLDDDDDDLNMVCCCALVAERPSNMSVYLRDGSAQCTCYYTEIEVADQTCYLTQPQYTDTGPTSSSADPMWPGACQGSHWSTNVQVTGMTPPGKIPTGKV